MTCKFITQALLASILTSLSPVFAQTTTVTFKPGAAAGEDTWIRTTYGCTLPGQPSPEESINYGNSVVTDCGDWSLGSCPEGTARTLIRFKGFDTLPDNITINSAILKLFGLPSSVQGYDNSYYPNSSFPSNDCSIFRVSPGTSGNWQESIVTWGMQPPYVHSDSAIIAGSAAQWEWNTSVDVTQLVQKMEDDKENGMNNYNNGFLLKLNDEQMYRSMHFASSDYTDPKYWPELVINYTLKPTAIGNIKHTTNNIQVSPNPSSDFWKVAINVIESEHYQCELFDLLGHRLFEKTSMLSSSSNTIIIENSQLTKGLYLLKVSSSVGTNTIKVQKL